MGSLLDRHNDSNIWLILIREWASTYIMNDKSNLGQFFLDKFNPINWLIPITDWSHQPIDPIIYDPIKRHPLYNPFTNKMSNDF